MGDADNIMVSAVDPSLESLPHIQMRLKRGTVAKILFPNHSALVCDACLSNALLKKTYNLRQNKEEQLTPSPPPPTKQ